MIFDLVTLDCPNVDREDVRVGLYGPAGYRYTGMFAVAACGNRLSTTTIPRHPRDSSGSLSEAWSGSRFPSLRPR